jgi:hypothetical protein
MTLADKSQELFRIIEAAAQPKARPSGREEIMMAR